MKFWLTLLTYLLQHAQDSEQKEFESHIKALCPSHDILFFWYKLWPLKKHINPLSQTISSLTTNENISFSFTVRTQLIEVLRDLNWVHLGHCVLLP